MSCLPIDIVADYKESEVYTAEGKRIGRIKEISSGYITAFKRGLVMDGVQDSNVRGFLR